MMEIDMQKIRATLPINGKATLRKEIIKGKSVVSIICEVMRPSLSEREPMQWEKDFEMIKGWQKEIVGEALSEFYTKTEGMFWTIYLKRIPMEFINTTDEDIKAYSGFSKEQLLTPQP